MNKKPFQSSLDEQIEQTSKQLDEARKAEAQAKAQIELQAQAQVKLLADAKIAQKEQNTAETSILLAGEQMLKADNDKLEICLIINDKQTLDAINSQSKTNVQHGNGGSMLRFVPHNAETRKAMQEMLKHFRFLQELGIAHNSKIINEAERSKKVLDVDALQKSTFYKLDAEAAPTPETPAP